MPNDAFSGAAPRLYFAQTPEVSYSGPGEEKIRGISKDHRDHEQKLELVFKRLQEKGLRLNKDKCKFAVNAVEI
ncbi:hypothetical protein LAZ67_14002823 [Cordylochernes scorpioides]|uniref:Reverse transcriptase n=1 Tax=Cordylochernes scorpioides TaxID=51811 RepID=A0ABY6L790_9ARAC|nr:hypothetical protein LAZ67_14002823 [Cordylochernes scorpioides]